MVNVQQTNVNPELSLHCSIVRNEEELNRNPQSTVNVYGQTYVNRLIVRLLISITILKLKPRLQWSLEGYLLERSCKSLNN